MFRTSMAALAILIMTGTMYAADYSAMSLGTLGGTSGDAYDINSYGQVVGWTQDADNKRRPFIWTQPDGMKDLGTLPGGDIGQAYGMNDEGWVVGTSANAEETWNATLWRPGEQPLDIGSLPGYSQSFATDVNNLGQVVGVARRFGDNVEDRAFLWTLDGGMIDLGTLGGSSVATAINALGQIVGQSELPSSTRIHAFRYTDAAHIADIYPEFPNRDYAANAINNAGAIVGQAEQFSGMKVPALWSEGMGEPVFAPVPYGWANDISNNGLIVGKYMEDAVPLAFLWDGADSFLRLPDLSTEQTGHSVAEAINDTGWIVGTSCNDAGHALPVIWVPEPATVSFLTLGGMALFRHKQ